MFHRCIVVTKSAWCAAGEMRPPLTVVLINNGGGGIFSFLPVAEEVPSDIFSQLWATPQNVDLAGMALPLAPISCFLLWLLFLLLAIQLGLPDLF